MKSGGSRPMSENTVNGALRRMGFTKNEMTAYDFGERRKMMLAWADYLGKLAKIIPLQGKTAA